MTTEIPSWRVDIDRLPDLYEEVIRHVGYANVPSALPVLGTAPGRRHPNWELVDRARRAVDPELRREEREYRRLGRLTDEIDFIEPTETEWRAHWSSIYNRVERGIGWLL